LSSPVEVDVGRYESGQYQPGSRPLRIDLHSASKLERVVSAQGMTFSQSHGVLSQCRSNLNHRKVAGKSARKFAMAVAAFVGEISPMRAFRVIAAIISTEVIREM
jgi:hypothetical protein